MSDYYEGLVACKQCGDIRQGNNREYCRRCKGTGRLYRMMSVADLTASAERNERDGYRRVAIKTALIRDALLSAE